MVDHITSHDAMLILAALDEGVALPPDVRQKLSDWKRLWERDQDILANYRRGESNAELVTRWGVSQSIIVKRAKALGL